MDYEQHKNMSQNTVVRLQPVFAALREAFEFSQKVMVDHWQFAVEIEQLYSCGATPQELQALTREGLIMHAEETTPGKKHVRTYRHADSLGFSPNSCFVLSNEGLQAMKGNGMTSNDGKEQSEFAPVWNDKHCELRFARQLIKRFKWRAPNQETLLLAFQQQGWPSRIIDPLPPNSMVDPKRRLHDTIKCLNRRHSRNLIRFHGDGTGGGVVWRIVDSTSQSNNNDFHESMTLGKV